MRKLFWMLGLVALVLPMALPTHAQTPSDTLFIATSDGLWAGNEASANANASDLAENENFNHDGPLALSPTGQFVAYQSVLAGFNGASGPAPTNVYLYDLTSNSIITVYEQTNVDLANGIYSDVGEMMSWSPDGSRLAFTTLAPGGNLALHIFDVAASSDLIVADNLPSSIGLPIASDVAFTSLGVAIINTALSGDSQTEVLRIYDPNSGAEVLNVDFGTQGIIDTPIEYFVAQRGNDEILVVSMLNTIVFYNLSTRAFDSFDGVLQMSVLDTGVKINYLPLGAQGGIWEAETADGSRVALPYQGLWRNQAIAISPSGATVAYVADGVTLWASGTPIGNVSIASANGTPTPFNTSLVWGVATWQIVDGGYG